MTSQASEAKLGGPNPAGLPAVGAIQIPQRARKDPWKLGMLVDLVWGTCRKCSVGRAADLLVAPPRNPKDPSWVEDLICTWRAKTFKSLNFIET